MILLCKLAAAVLVAAVLTLLLKKDQPAFALLVSVCTAAGLLAVAMHQIEPLLAWLRTLEVYFQGQSPAVLLRALGIALVAQFAADTCREAGLARPPPPSSSAAGCWCFCRLCRCCGRCSAPLRTICSNFPAGGAAPCLCGRAAAGGAGHSAGQPRGHHRCRRMDPCRHCSAAGGLDRQRLSAHAALCGAVCRVSFAGRTAGAAGRQTCRRLC